MYIFIALVALLIVAGVAIFASLNKNQEPVSEDGVGLTVNEPQCENDPAANDEPQEECVTPPGINNSDDASTTPNPTPAPTPKPETKPAPESQGSPQQPTPSEISRGDTSKKQVIFTFDGGAGAQSLAEILNTLQKHNVKSTFFVTGKWANANSAGLKQISSAGHEIFNHTYNHPNLTTIDDQAIKQEFQLAEQVVRNLTGKSTKPYFRPPFGARNQHVLDVAWTEGYRSVYWTIDALDWQESATASSVKQRILNNVAPGNIYLMHIGDDITGQVLDEVFTTIKNRGYSIVSLSTGL